ncbi:MAG: hypothetical protein M1832_000053 [Thelocarpon impressellum]|nr:MAG: hypothetical protein M1832_000053 [Thelocarpon impressellum]
MARRLQCLDTRRPHNGDGFGVGYYTDPKLGPEPCIFISTIPAWNCINLERLASKTMSSLIFAHVRATTDGTLVHGGTDNEWAFALFVDSMEKIGHDPSADVADGGFDHSVLCTAMLRTIERINLLIADIPERYRAASKLDTHSLHNFAVTDGFSVVCTRYVSSRTDEAASLYFS